MSELGCTVFSTNRLVKLDTHRKRKKARLLLYISINGKWMKGWTYAETVKGLRETSRKSFMTLVLAVMS